MLQNESETFNEKTSYEEPTARTGVLFLHLHQVNSLLVEQSHHNLSDSPPQRKLAGNYFQLICH